MHSLSQISAVILLVVLTGCANKIKIAANYNNTINFKAWKTYAWLPDAQTGLSDPRLNAAFIDPQVRGDVNRELATKGYVESALATADFLVSYSVSMEDKIGNELVTDGPLYSAVSVSTQDGFTSVVAYQNPMAVSHVDISRTGTLVLKFRNPQTKQSVWHGIAQARLIDNSQLAQRQERLKNAIHLILDKFPPK